MGLQQDGQFGLRRRLWMALEPDGDYARVAAVIGTTPELLHEYLTDPSFLWDNNTYLLILEGLFNLPAYSHIRDTGPRWRIVFLEKPRWAESDVFLIEAPEEALQVAVFTEAETYAEDIMTNGPEDLRTFTVQQVIDAATNGDYDRLFTVVWYEPIALFPYPPGF